MYHLLRNMADWLIRARNIITPIVMIIFLLLIYKFLQTEEICIEDNFREQYFPRWGWMVISWVFSVYVDVFKGFCQYVRKSDNDHVDHDVDVFLHVLHFDWRRAEHLVLGKKIDESEER